MFRDTRFRAAARLSSIAETCVDDATDAGRDIAFAGAEILSVEGQHLALKRVVGNLVGNALRYAETTPGPLILVLQFVGFLAGFRAPDGLTGVAGGGGASLLVL